MYNCTLGWREIKNIPWILTKFGGVVYFEWGTSQKNFELSRYKKRGAGGPQSAPLLKKTVPIQSKWREKPFWELRTCNLSFCIFLDHLHLFWFKTQTATGGSKSCRSWYSDKIQRLSCGEWVIKNGQIKKLIADSYSAGQFNPI